jgi:methyltransferase (TIGR00027 family)
MNAGKQEAGLPEREPSETTWAKPYKMGGIPMDEGKPSKTAVIAAIFRAVHLFLDGEPKILKDDLAFGFSDLPNTEALHTFLQSLEAKTSGEFGPETGSAMWRGYRGFVVARARYAEDELERAMGRGVSQYVILGAGLDSFAFRSPDTENVLTVYEVDYPASQQWKRRRLQELGVSVPKNLVFVPLNLQEHTLSEVLRTAGYRADLPTFFSLLGVTQYLTETAVFEILREVVSAAPGTGIVFEYVLDDSLLTERNRQIVAMHKKNSSASGEPWLTQFDSAILTKRVKELGFTEVFDFGPDEAEAQYFVGRTDQLAGTGGLGGFGFVHLMKALR